MNRAELKHFGQPDEVREFPKGRVFGPADRDTRRANTVDTRFALASVSKIFHGRRGGTDLARRLLT
jgi:hypothetical protein